MNKFLLAVFAVAAVSIAAFGAETGPITVDFSRTVGKIRPLNGVCNTTPMTGGLDAQVRRLEIPIFRFHDAALENPGYQLVDISRVFLLFHADADDPRNYNFKATDDYLKQCVDMGAAMEFRLGESIEHGKNKYAVNPPSNGIGRRRDGTSGRIRRTHGSRRRGPRASAARTPVPLRRQCFRTCRTRP